MRVVTPPIHLRAVVPLICVAAAIGGSVLLSVHARATSAPVAPKPATALRSDRPSVEVISEQDHSIVLRFEATERSSRGARSVFVRVPDAGRIETELSDVPGLDAAKLIEISEPAIMRDLRVVHVLFSPTPEGAETEDYARSLTVTLRATDAPGINEKKETGRALSRAFHGLYKSTVINYDAEAALEALAAQARDGRDPRPFGASYLAISVDN